MKIKLIAGIIFGMGIFAGAAQAAEQIIDVTFLNNSGVGTTTSAGTIALTTQIAPTDIAPPQDLVYTISDLNLDDIGGNNDSVQLTFTATTDGQNIFARLTAAGWLSSGGVTLNGNGAVPGADEFLTMTFTSMDITADDMTGVSGSFLGFTSVQMGSWGGGHTSVVNGVTYGSVDGVENKNIDLTIDGNSLNDLSVTTAFVDGISAGTFRPEKYDFQIEVIPEPATLGIVAVFGGALLFIRRKMMM